MRQTLYRTVVTLPAHHCQPAVTVTAILAREEQPPAGQPAIEWRLLTNRTAETLEQVVELIDWYRRRWRVEGVHTQRGRIGQGHDDVSGGLSRRLIAGRLLLVRRDLAIGRCNLQLAQPDDDVDDDP